ncbi:MAG TPA: segregation/condensation protein A [Bdellovibrionales bacterium]|nr:segregation/condensation protein A [Bdellovibrionales bacterium]
MSIHVQLERFEGPLGLLLHLIREQEMDVFNINIHQITRQYLEYIKTMRRLDLEVAGEFIAMAATLLHIKSRMLLPNYNEDGEEVKEDPRKELVQKLLEYKKMRELSADLYKLPLLGRDVFKRGEREEVEALEEGELILEENPLFSLIASYRTAIKNMKKTVHKVATELQSIAERILEMRNFLVVGKRILFRELITDTRPESNQILVTFLSLLELAKIGFVSIFQNEPFADIHVEPKKTIERDVVTRVESYDNANAEQKAEEIMVEAQLTLDEPDIMLDAEETPVVRESFADAATDEDIAAEEARLDASDMGVPLEPDAPVVEDMGLHAYGHTDPVEQTEPVIQTIPDEALAETEPHPATEPSIVERNLNSALSAALSAFDAFNDEKPVAASSREKEEEPKNPDRPPEVDV